MARAWYAVVIMEVWAMEGGTDRRRQRQTLCSSAYLYTSTTLKTHVEMGTCSH
ncbi:hypothetical protein PC123_g22875 [Phytophthora cactorum]|nr:hypothetical protein PC120_g22380 [Phytophthora cactorum]KAG4041616.1 hypothetical protein PC123_g22875 [Phytophthora cactorum]